MRLKQISKRSLAMLLTVLMIFSTLFVGSVSTASSATTDANTSGALTTNKVVYFHNSNCTGNVNLYTYESVTNGNWPGTKMTLVDKYYKIYVGEAKSGASKIIFNGDGFNQSKDNNIIPIDSNNFYNHDTDKWEVINFDNYKYYVAGTMNGWVANGDLMTRGSDGKYYRTYTLDPTQTHSFKITNGTWNAAWPSDYNNNYVINANDYPDDKPKCTICFNPATQTISVSYEAASGHTGGYVYFEKPDSWDDEHIMLITGNNKTGTELSSTAYDMQNVPGTNLYYYDLSQNLSTTNPWAGATYVAVVGATEFWDDGNNWGADNRTKANHYTNVYNGDYQFDSGSTYYITPASGNNNANIEIDYLGKTATTYNTLNSTQTVKVKSSTDGGSTYSDTTATGNVTISACKLTGNGSVTSYVDSTTASKATASVSAAKTATVTLEATPTKGSEFVGWFEGSSTTAVSTNTTYTYNATEIKTLTAKFKGVPAEQHTVTATVEGGNGTISPATQSIAEGAKYTVTVTPNSNYELSSLKVDGQELSSLVVNNAYTGEMGYEDISIVAKFDKIDNTKPRSIIYEREDGVSLGYPSTAVPGTTVEVTVNVEYGYTCTQLLVNGNVVQITNGKATFTMPAENVKLSTNVAPADMSTPWKYYGSVQNREGIANYSPYNMVKGSLNGKEFAYVYIDDNQFFNKDITFYVANNTTTYTRNSNSDVFPQNFGGSDIKIQEWGGSAKIYTGNPYYLVVFYPKTDYTNNGQNKWNDNIINNTNSYPIVAAFSDLPSDQYVSKFTVTMDQGVTDYYLNSSSRGTSLLYTNKTTDRFEITDNTVSFSTETKAVTNTELGVNNMYIYKVYGYSILINYKDGSKKVVSIDEHAISTPEKGKYSAQYTFDPSETGSEVKSAVITPLFTSSDEYAELKGINHTTVYLKVQPGDNLFDNTYEPRYYTWRIVETSGGNTQSWVNSEKDNKKIQSLPEGWWKGQKMLYIGNGMYKAVVEDHILGITFVSNDSDTQTFDYSEFIKLQDLGYDQITFEPKKGVSGQSVAASLKNKYKDESTVYTPDTTDSSSYINSELTKTNFELDVNIEGYYVDVFGNKLTDLDGNFIKQSDLRNEMTAELNTSNEATALLTKMGIINDSTKEKALYGARYGVVNVDGSFYGMTYATRVYYFEVTGDKTYMVSQQVSGFGTIEGAYSPIESGVPNAQAYHNSKGKYMQYALGANPSKDAAQDFDGTIVDGKATDVGYDLIPKKFVNVPYFVSYQFKVDKRIDGKWYYQDTTPVLPYDLQMGLMGSDNKVIMDDTTKEIKINPIGGTAIFTESGTTYVEIESGKTTTLIATPNPGYKFVGFYEPNGNRLSANNNYVYSVASSGTIFAVFQALKENTLVVTNNVYRGNNPKDGGGNGEVTVTLYVYDSQTDTTPEVYTGKNIVQASVTEGKWFKWVITGKPSGLDKFIAFRAPDAITGVYTKLDVSFEEDGYGYKYDPVTGVHSFTSDFMQMDWDNYGENVKTLTIDNVTDFSKTSYKVNLHYCYLNRYNQNREYIVTNIELTEDEMKNDFTPSKATIDNNAPYIDEVFKNCTWSVNEDLSNVTQTGADYYLDAIHEDRLFTTYISTDGITSNSRKDAYNTLITIEAPKTNKSGKEFMYWVQYRVDSNGKVVGNEDEENIISYYNKVSLRVTFDSKLVAVYNENNVVIPDFATNVQKPEYTREQYTENGVNYDYIYSDLLLQFDISQKLGNGMSFGEYYAANSNAIKFGIVLESNVAYKYDATSTMINPTPTKDYLEQTITNLASNTGSGKSNGGWSVTEEDTSPEYNYYYNLYDLTDNADKLSDLGRVDYIFRFNNTETNRGIVYNVYSYILYTDPNTREKTLYLSNPVVMNIYSIGTQENEKG